MKEKKLTMQNIAKMAGVGKTTVSRYFNGGYVKDETREKIKKSLINIIINQIPLHRVKGKGNKNYR